MAERDTARGSCQLAAAAVPVGTAEIKTVSLRFFYSLRLRRCIPVFHLTPNFC